MNILVINYMETTAPGGINKVVREVSKNLSKNHEITVIQPNPLNLSNDEFYEGFRIIRVNSKIGRHVFELSPEIYFFLKKNLRALNPDVIHIHGYHNLFSLEVLYFIHKFDSKIPLIFSPHYDIFSHDTFAGKYLWNAHNTISSRIVKSVDMFIAASIFEAKNINKDLRVPTRKIRVISHGIDSINLKTNLENKDSVKLLYVGYLLELKGVKYIIEALNVLIKNNVKAELTIIGEGPYEEKLRKLACEFNLNSYINWCGFIHPKEGNKLLKFFKESDIFLLLSKSENYGIVVTEALSMGTPAIVTNRTALKEFLNEPGCYGVDYPPSPKKVADLIIEIRDGNYKVGPFSKKIRNWDSVAKDYESVYADLIVGE